MSSAGQRLRVGIAGGRGYGGAETLRLLLSHPLFDVCGVTSRRHAGERVDAVHPHLAGFYEDLVFVERPEELLEAEPDALILALPHKHAAEHARRLAEAAPDVRIVDLSGDHRLADSAAYEAAYGAVHPHPEELASGDWVYGLTEAHREALRGAHRVANPGCFATGAALAALPLARRGLIAGPVRHVAISGSSGSGADAKTGTHHPERVEDVKAYKVLAHQHVPEIVRCLETAGMAAGTPWLMVPQSGPFARGIFTTLFVDLADEIGNDELAALYAEEYAGEPFVRMRAGTPRVGHVAGTNFCDLSVHAAGRTAVVLGTIDNLGKGMAGQALQNLNLMFGLPEALGLRRPGSRP